jgi:hypothetical protein
LGTPLSLLPFGTPLALGLDNPHGAEEKENQKERSRTMKRLNKGVCVKVSCSLDPDILECDISSQSLSAYFKSLDLERRPFVVSSDTKMMAGFLSLLGFAKIKDLHSTIERGWDSFLAYERDVLKPTVPSSGLMAVYYTLIIADPKARKLFYRSCQTEMADLQKYFCC